MPQSCEFLAFDRQYTGIKPRLYRWHKVASFGGGWEVLLSPAGSCFHPVPSIRKYLGVVLLKLLHPTLSCSDLLLSHHPSACCPALKMWAHWEGSSAFYELVQHRGQCRSVPCQCSFGIPSKIHANTFTPFYKEYDALLSLRLFIIMRPFSYLRLITSVFFFF